MSRVGVAMPCDGMNCTAIVKSCYCDPPVHCVVEAVADLVGRAGEKYHESYDALRSRRTGWLQLEAWRLSHGCWLDHLIADPASPRIQSTRGRKCCNTPCREKMDHGRSDTNANTGHCVGRLASRQRKLVAIWRNIRTSLADTIWRTRPHASGGGLNSWRAPKKDDPRNDRDIGARRSALAKRALRSTGPEPLLQSKACFTAMCIRARHAMAAGELT